MRYRAIAITVVLTFAISAAALAAGPLKGKTYEGAAPASGVDSEGQKERLDATSAIVLAVAHSGKAVTVRFASTFPVLFCRPSKPLSSQTTKPAKISAGGSFRATVSQRFAAGPGPAAIVQVVSGRFSGRTVKGTIHTEAGECGGVSSFSATVS
ncbi:MAG TPA: hypothetical protein VMB51_01320 [Solirubrobacteraceae bacterium]|nr:hypothetical protein [Solirubrobacteraceae bacterium]